MPVEENASDDVDGTAGTRQFKYILNDLLTYVQFHIDRCTQDNLKKVLCRFYTPEIIADAKNTLWNLEEAKPVLGKRLFRQKSLSRDVNEADVVDIISAFYKIDKVEYFDVRFVLMNLENVPKFSPEDTEEDVTTARVSQHDQRIQAVEDRTDKQAESIRTLQMLVNDLIQAKPTPSYSATVKSAPPSVGKQVNEMSKTFTVKPSENTIQERVSLRPNIASHAERQSVFLMPESSGSDKGSRDVSPSGFRFQKQELKRQRRAAIIGKRQNAKIRSGAKYIELFVSRVHNDVEIDELKKFIEEDGINIIDIGRVSHKEARMQSFKVIISSSDKDTVLNESFWPEGIMCRQFFTRRNIKLDE
jgi:hypothetical protein